jgi:hypothetical protein
MAHYTASARSNKFRVKDISALKQDMHPAIEVCIEDQTTNTVYLLVTDDDGAGWPTWIEDEHKGEPVNVPWNIVYVVAPHLVDGEWCVIQEVGSEKLRYVRYLVGYSTAFNNQSVVINIDIGDIYKQLPAGVTPCSY